MQESQDNAAGMQQPTEGYNDHMHFSEVSPIDQCLALGSSGGKGSQAMAMDQGESMKPFCTYEASAFKSGPRSNNLSGSSNSGAAGTPNVPTPPESMKIATGFVPKIKKPSPSPPSILVPTAIGIGVKATTGSAFSPPSYIVSHSSHPPAPAPAYMLESSVPRPAFMPVIPNIALPPAEPFQSVQYQAIRHSPAPVSEHDESSSQLPAYGAESELPDVKEDPDSSDNNNPAEDRAKHPIEKGKKERNRVSAQKCRMRKKQYIESLEGQVKQLKDELTQCKEELKTLKEKHEHLLLKDDPGHYKTVHIELLNKLHKALSENQPSQCIQDLIRNIDVLFC